MKFKNINNPFNFSIDKIFCVGKRVNNPKRNFLFISKLLGKRIPVFPDVCKATGHLLASLCYPEISSELLVKYLENPTHCNQEIKKLINTSIDVGKKTLIIGFAEAATGLGMSVASAIRNCTYYSTTREKFNDKKFLFSFEEVHSHATTHNCYDDLNTSFSSFDEIILVDDEITTGNSLLNLIEKIHELSNISTYRVLTILDWRDEKCKERFKAVQTNKNINIEVFSILSGNIVVDDNTVFEEGHVESLPKLETSYEIESELERVKCIKKDGLQEYYYKNSGRFGITHNNIEKIESIAKNAADKIFHQILLNKDNIKKILVISEGEDIYITSRIASYFPSDIEVLFKATSMCPMYADGEIIKEKHTYIGHSDFKYYFYNKKETEENYDIVLFISEFPVNAQLTSNMINISLKN